MTSSTVRTTLLSLALAGGVVAGGATLASAADSPATPSSTPSSSAAPSSGTGGDGRITAVDDGSLTLVDASGQSSTFTLSSGTTVHQGPETDLAVADLAVGERVHVRGSDGAATDVDVHPAHIDGTVVSVDGDRVTVTDHDGFTRQISTASGTTYRAGDGGSADASGLTAGVMVHAEGTVDADGTTLDAATVVIGARPGPAGHGDKDSGKGGPPAPRAGGPAGGPAAGGPAAGGPAAGGPAAGGPAADSGDAPAAPPTASASEPATGGS